MPLLQYFGFVGSALVTLLFGLSWCFPQPVSDRTGSGIDRSIIRINSVEKVPDRVDIDTRYRSGEGRLARYDGG
jgi:hypothetical protein